MIKTRLPKLSLILPVHCEGAHLAASLSVVMTTIDAVERRYEVVLVDDGSTDDSWSVIEDLVRGNDRVRGLRLSRQFGKEAAVSAGIEAARGEAFIVMDADLQHPPSLIPKMIEIWRSGCADVVEAVKSPLSDESRLVRARRRLFNKVMWILSGLDLADSSDFKLFTRPVRDAWLRMGEKNLFFRGMLAWLGFRRVRVRFEVPRRAAGASRWSSLRLLGMAATSLTAFSNLPVRLASATGLVFVCFSIAFGTYAVVLKMRGGALTGFTTVILLQLVIGSGVFLALGIIGEYVGRIYEEVKNRPRYVVAELTREARRQRPVPRKPPE